MASIAKTSRLNPNANEFVPSGKKIPQSTTSDGLANNTIKKYLSITIMDSGTTHEGYCSDPVDISSYENEDNVIEYDFPHKDKIICSEIINDEEDLTHDDILNDIRNYVNKKYRKFNKQCNIGSGYCNCSSDTRVIRIKICLKK